jgi:hypothetical protein
MQVKLRRHLLLEEIVVEAVDIEDGFVGLTARLFPDEGTDNRAFIIVSLLKYKLFVVFI